MARSTDQVMHMARRAAYMIKGHISIGSAYLFGSYSSGKANDDSDIDIAVFSPEVVGMFIEQKMESICSVQKDMGAEIEIHLYPEHCLGEARPTNIYGHILSTGIPIDIH